MFDNICLFISNRTFILFSNNSETNRKIGDHKATDRIPVDSNK